MDAVSNQGLHKVFGCSVCWPETAEAAWEARKNLIAKRWLVDESHFRVVVVMCPTCSQRFVSVFMETIDWADGEDPMYWSIVPLDASEADEISLENFAQVGTGRRSLFHAFPKGAPEETRWDSGVVLMPHD